MKAMTEQERSFTAAVAGRARVGHIAKALGRGYSTIAHIVAAQGTGGVRKSGAPILSQYATVKAWQSWQAGTGIPEGLDMLMDAAQPGRSVWSEAETLELVDNAPGEPLANIAARLGRTERACWERLRAVGQRRLPYRYQVARFPAELMAARGIRVAANTVSDWIVRGHVRGFKQGGVARCIHPEDYLWLLDNYEWRETDWARLKEEVWNVELEEVEVVQHKPVALSLSNLARAGRALGKGMADTIHASCKEQSKRSA